MRTIDLDELFSRFPRPWLLVLEFEPSLDEAADYSKIRRAVPWIWQKRECLPSLERLREDGFAMVSCDSPEEACRRFDEVQGTSVKVGLLDPAGGDFKLPRTEDVRKLRGVYPTPRPLTRWVVRSVSALLQSRLGLPEGLAAPGLQLLDPAAGPANFILEAYRRALAEHRARFGRASLPWLLHENLFPGFQGIEILPGPWAAGQEGVRRFLVRNGLPVERAPLFLADALAAPGEMPSRGFLGEEAAKAERVRREEAAAVVLGNPPFNGSPETGGEWITALVREAYLQVDGQGLGERNVKWLRDDYVKFLRLGQWMVERRGEGIVAFVVNHNCLEAPTFRGLRHSLLKTFDQIFALDLHGNRRKREDENVFEGVAQGIAVLLLIKKPGLPKAAFQCDLHGTRREKLQTLARSGFERMPWTEVRPRAPLYLFRVSDLQKEKEFRRGTPLPEIFPLHSLGVVTGWDAALLALDREEFERRLVETGWKHRRRCLASFLARPFDVRSALYDDLLMERPRKAVMEHLRQGLNLGLLALRQTSTAGPGAFVTRGLAGHKVVSSYAPNTVFPLYLLGAGGERAWPNVAPELRRTLGDLHGSEPSPEEVFGFVYAVLHSEGYRARYQEQLRHEFPRIAFPSEPGRFRGMAALGWELARLHLLEDPRLLAAPVRLKGGLGFPLARVAYDDAGGRILLNEEGLFFEWITSDVWNYQIGTYRVLERWLKARAGRVLGHSEAREFRSIAEAVRLTLDFQDRIEGFGRGGSNDGIPL